jgi:hypothetical protein
MTPVVYLRLPGAGRLKYADIENAVRRIALEPVPGVKTEFTDRDRALAQAVEWAEKSIQLSCSARGAMCNMRLVASGHRELGLDVVNVDVFT